MKSKLSASEDKRENLLLPTDVNRWYDIPFSIFRIGIKNIGEIRMGAEAFNFLIQTSDNIDWMNFGNYKFMYIDWNTPFLFSEDGEYLVSNWVYFHVQNAITPVVFNLPQKTFGFLEPKRILKVKRINSINGSLVAVCDETKWVNSKQQELTNIEFPISAYFRPIDEFYFLDPMSVETNVYIWKGETLEIEPLREYTLNDSSEC
jgi:hypothetical protein